MRQQTSSAQVASSEADSMIAKSVRCFATAFALSAQQTRLLELLAHGYSRKEASVILTCSLATINTYCGRMSVKIAGSSRGDLILALYQYVARHCARSRSRVTSGEGLSCPCE